MESTLIFGLGGIGAVCALILKRSKKASISTVARSNYEALRENGLQVESHIFGHETLQFEDVYRSSSIDTPQRKFSYIFITTKALAHITPSLSESIAPYVTPGATGTTIVLAQNGVGIEDQFRLRWPNNCIITCVVWIGATQIAPGRVRHHGSKKLAVGPFNIASIGPKSPTSPYELERLDTFAKMLVDGGAEVAVVRDHVLMQAKRWVKLACNCACNPLTALTDLDIATHLGTSSFSEQTSRRILREVIAIARGLGMELDAGGNSPEDAMMELVHHAPPTNSMRIDAQNRRTMEVEAILGYPLACAKSLGIETPTLETLYVLMNALDARFSGRIKAHL